MNEKIKVFLSRPNPFTSKQQAFLDKIEIKLREWEIEPITLKAADYDLTDSMEYLCEMIKRCCGIVLLCFGQTTVKNGIYKEGFEKEFEINQFDKRKKRIKDEMYTSPFCHIEGTLGIANGLPLLIMRQKRVITEGILKGGRFSIVADDFSIDDDINEYLNRDVNRMKIDIWKNRVTEKALFLRQLKYTSSP